MKMEKVKLTKEQVTALEKAINDYGIDTTMNDHSPHNWGGFLSPLNELKIHQMARALYIGYEVEETFEVGDWVVYDNGVERGYGYKTNQIKDVDGQKAYFDEGRTMYLTSLRHATPEEIATEKQRRWWAKHGRDVWELKENDLLISKHDKHSCQVKFVEAADEYGVLLVDGIKDEFYEGEHDLQILQDRYKVICFAENRKDLEV